MQHLAPCLSLDDPAGLPQLASWGASSPHKELLPLSKNPEGVTDHNVLDALAIRNLRAKTKLAHRNDFIPQFFLCMHIYIYILSLKMFLHKVS